MRTVDRGTEIVGPKTARTRFGNERRIIELEGGELVWIGRPIGAHPNGGGRHSCCGKDRAHFVQRMLGGNFVVRAAWHINHDSTARLAPPRAGECQHVGALIAGQTAAAAADE